MQAERSLSIVLKLFNNRLGLHATGSEGTQEDSNGPSFSSPRNRHSVAGQSFDDRGVRDVMMGSDGSKFDRFLIKTGGARYPRDDSTCAELTDKSGNVRSDEDIHMDGFGVLSFFNSVIPEHVLDLLSRNNLTVDDIDLFVFHQASRIAIESIGKALNIPRSKLSFEMKETGNLVSASVPVALKKSLERGQVSEGNLVVLCGFGVGFSWATALLRI